MTLLNDELIDIEPVPLGQLGVQVWYSSGESIYNQYKTNVVEELQKVMDTDPGWSNSTESILRMLLNIDSTIMGIDIYKASPGYSIFKHVTFPEHWMCKVFCRDGTSFHFIMINPDLIQNCDKVYYRGKIEYDRFAYAHKATKVTNETLLDLTKDKRSLSTIGTFERAFDRWEPLQTKDAVLLYSR